MLVLLSDALPIPVVSVQRFDLDIGLPAGYPALRVYCFDLQPEGHGVFERAVEFDAQGAAGGRTVHQLAFTMDQPDVSVQMVHFPFAVDIRKPFRYRIRTTLLNGQQLLSDWQEKDNWAAIVDITGVGIPNVDSSPPPAQEIDSQNGEHNG